jgi:hypothetical protein
MRVPLVQLVRRKVTRVGAWSVKLEHDPEPECKPGLNRRLKPCSTFSLSVSHRLQIQFTSLSDSRTMSKRLKLKGIFGRKTPLPGREDSRALPAFGGNEPALPKPPLLTRDAGTSLVKSSSRFAHRY